MTILTEELPGIDIVGRGAYTFTSYPTSTDTNGHKWGIFLEQVVLRPQLLVKQRV